MRGTQRTTLRTSRPCAIAWDGTRGPQQGSSSLYKTRIVGTNALSVAVCASLLSARRNRTRMGLSALTSRDVIRPIPDATKLQSRELLRCAGTYIREGSEEDCPAHWARGTPKVSRSNRMFRQRFGGPGETVFEGGFARIP